MLIETDFFSKLCKLLTYKLTLMLFETLFNTDRLLKINWNKLLKPIDSLHTFFKIYNNLGMI